METDKTNRKFSRHAIPAFIQAPQLSDSHIVPIDISEGGFKAVVDKPPSSEGPISCDINVNGELFENCQVRVAWLQEIDSSPPACLVGIAIEKIDDQDRLHTAIEGLNKLFQFK
ncbi:MAG: PilZ domain-containing protein [bacterium]